ncbi:urea ABC transporter permease subunit UrtB [Vibrio comitans]|uniref:Branched-chain amino acid ABC transporter permease n=1 Tax=Vibrio comitans NBRC 102076 TaxID=1219078 RepID=A0A4Y3IQ65_9VIBR|nr:urea ABC transporter permease subunit UrtB [Vibrio comitans]GEA61262.1 branched-chain amino acid ABC transporter permease [Vibrio comitans NBRC 102076]
MKRIFLTVVTLISLCFAQLSTAAVTDESSFSKALVGKKNADKESAITWLVTEADAQKARPILQNWLEGKLYYFNDRSSDLYKSIYFVSDLKVGLDATSIWDASTLSIENRRDYKKVSVNNKLRGLLRIQMAILGLDSPDANMRKQSVSDLLGTKDSAVLVSLGQRLEVETEDEIIDLITLSLAVSRAQDQALDSATRVAAIEVLGESKQAIVLKTLNGILASEQQQSVLVAAERSLAKYEQSQRLYSGVETAFFGLSLGSVLVLAGIGLAITFGVMGVINMAHGELIMIGAYTTYVLQQLMPNNIGMALILSIPAAFIVSGLVGIAIERSVIRHLYGRPLETLLATFGISLILQQAVRSIFSPLNRSVSTPEWMSGALQLNPMLSLTYNRLYIVLFCGLVFWGLLMVLKKTPLGLQVRAVSQNRGMARAMGIRSERVDALTFGLGSGVAGIAGVALSQLTNVGPNMGQAYIIDSFMVVVFGGVGNLWGTLVAGLSLGIFNKVLEPWAGAVLAKILVLVFIILFIQKRPRGLFPQRGRAAEG